MPEPSRQSVVQLQTAAGRPDRNRCWASVAPSASLFPDCVLRTLIPPDFLLFSCANQNANATCADGCRSVDVSYAGQIPLSSEQRLVRCAARLAVYNELPRSVMNIRSPETSSAS